MWSNQHHYFNIYSDIELSVSVDTQKLKQFLDTFSELESDGLFKYKNKSSFPFIEIFLLQAKNIDSWSNQDVNGEKTNLVSVVCSRGEFKKIEPLLNKIAHFLSWTLVEEDTNEDFK